VTVNINRKADLSRAGGFSDPGARSTNLLRLASDVVDAQTVTIGADVYEFEAINTDSTDDTVDGNFNTLNNSISILDWKYPNITIVVGTVIRIEDELLDCYEVDGAFRRFHRAYAGTTKVVHADGLNVYIGDGFTGGRIPVYLGADLTPPVFGPALLAAINDSGTEPVTAIIQSGQHILIISDEVGENALACSETLAGANNTWASATMVGGRDPALRQMSIVERVPTATEVTFGQLFFSFDFTPTIFLIFVAPTATPDANVAFDGTMTNVGDGSWILDKSGAVDWAATDTVTVIAIG